jgi:hypothetical protein
MAGKVVNIEVYGSHQHFLGNKVKSFEIRHKPYEKSYPQAENNDLRRLIALIRAYFAEKVLFAENKMYICRINCGE